MEPQTVMPRPGNNYDFIMNPEKPKRGRFLAGLGGDPFIMKIVVIIGGALLLIVVLTVAVNLFFGGKTNVETVVGIVQSNQEIVRLSGESEKAIGQEIKNAAINTRLSMKSQQRSWVAFLGERGRVLAPEELSLKKDTSTDSKLQLAEQTSTFDTTYTSTMRSLLEEYANALRAAYQGTANKQERDLLSKQYDGVLTLLEQWPSSSVGGN